MATNITDKPLCSICLNEFQEPTTIDCQHSFCFTCLKDYINKVSTNNQFPCPLCRNIVNIPSGGVMDFTTNVDVQQELASDVYKTEAPPCDVCKTGLNAEFKCENCEQYLCKSCSTTHAGLTVSRDHLVVGVVAGKSRGDHPTSTSIDFCRNDPGKVARCYCQDCSLSLCAECFVVGHNGHRFVDLLDEQTQLEAREKLKQLIEDLEARIKQFTEYSDSLKACIMDIDNSVDKSCAAVDKQVETICSEVKQLGEDVKIKIEKSRDDEVTKLTNPLKEMEILIEDLKASVKCTLNIIEEKSIVRVIHRIPQVQQEKEENSLRKFDIPSVKYTLFDESVMDKTMLAKQLGDVLHQEQSTFTTNFNLNDVARHGKKGLHSEDYYIQGLPWCLNAVKMQKKNTTPALSIYLHLSETVDTADIKSCQAKCRITLINIKGKQPSLIQEGEVDTYKPGIGVGWPKLQCWNTLSDKQKGFINENNNFTIQATVTVIKVERT